MKIYIARYPKLQLGQKERAYKKIRSKQQNTPNQQDALAHKSYSDSVFVTYCTVGGVG